MHIAIISSNRPHRVQPMTKALGSLTAHWYVPEDQVADYEYVGATVRPAGNQPASRNQALDDAFAVAMPCLLLSDDLTAAPDWWSHDTGLRHRITLDRAIALVMRRTQHVPTVLRGISATDNSLFMAKEEITEQCFIIGDFMLVWPTSLRFDVDMPLYSDLDFSLKVLDAFGRVARYNPVLANFEHRDNLGGTQDIRTPELEMDMIRVMSTRWPGKVIPNPARPNSATLVR